MSQKRTGLESSLTYALRSRLRYNEVGLDRNAGIAVVDEWNVGQNPRVALSIRWTPVLYKQTRAKRNGHGRDSVEGHT